jgi:Tfp pilus assembly protein PilV
MTIESRNFWRKRSFALRRRLGNRGVTLIETVVSLGLFAVSVGVMGQFLVHQIRAAGANDRYTTAYAIAERTLEDMRALRYADMASGSEETTSDGMRYDVTTTVDEDDPEANMKRIDVHVAWNEPSGAKDVALETIYTSITR